MPRGNSTGKRSEKVGTRTEYTVIKIRLHPSPEQAALIEKTFGCCRYLWNHMLADVQEFYAATDLQYIPTPAHYKKEAPFLKEVDSQPLCCVHQNLRRAFLNFFRSPAAHRFPQFRTKKARRDSFTVYCREYRTGPSIQLTDAGIQMPKLGLIPATVHRKPLHWWSLRFVTVSKTRSGKYFCSVTFGYDTKQPALKVPTRENTLGLNYSMRHFYTDSEGGNPVLPDLESSMAKLGRMQRKLSRMQYGSKNYERQLQRLRLQHEHIVNQRRDFIHKESRRIANAWDAVCVRDSDLVALSQKLPQSGEAARGFGLFRDCLKYKLERQGKCYITLDQYAPVAKTCHLCGGSNEALGSRETVWTCPHCGVVLSRSLNSARNIRDMGIERYRQKTKDPHAA